MGDAGNREGQAFLPVARTPRTLSAEAVQHFNQRDYVADLPLLDAAEADAHRAWFDGVSAQFRAAGKDAYSINGYHARLKTLHDLATHPLLLDYVEDLIGPDILCWGTHYFSKEPGDARAVPFHQDAVYWPFRPYRTLTAWIAVDDVDLENAPMCFLPGSHLAGPQETRERDGDVVLNLETIDYAAMGAPWPLTMQAGRVSLHTDLLVHGSAPNRSGRRRCGLTLRYVPPEVWVYADNDLGWTSRVLLCGGSADGSAWEPLEAPRGDELTLGQVRD